MSLSEMTVDQLAKKVLSNERLFILDVRNQDVFKDWKVEGKSIEIVNKPYVDLIEGVEDIVGELPQSEAIVVVCAKEHSSKFVGDMLVEAGFEEVFYLKGGMKRWSDHLEPVKIGDLSDGGSIYQFVRIGKGCLSYAIESGNEAVIIDPVRTIDPFISFAEERGLTIKHVVDTHLHADHISGGRAIREETGATYWLPPKDAEKIVFDYQELTEDHPIQFNGSDSMLRVIYSPGHTIGSTSIVVDNKYLLTGDVLFVQSIGRPDLAGRAEDWAGYLWNTLYRRYREMSEDLIVLPAHFGDSSELNKEGSVQEKLGVLFKENTGLQIKEAEFTAKVSENLPPQPNEFTAIRETNMGKQKPTQEEQQEMEIGPNRCAIN